MAALISFGTKEKEAQQLATLLHYAIYLYLILIHN
jgi:hypothetical protein